MKSRGSNLNLAGDSGSSCVSANAQMSKSLPNHVGIGTGLRRNEKSPFLIAVAGGTASGKTTVCRRILTELEKESAAVNHGAVIISQDSFYRPLNEEQRAEANRQNYNFDHPMAFDWELLAAVIRDLKAGRSVKIPEYDFITHSRTAAVHQIVTADVVLIEGILILSDPEIRRLFDMCVFVDVDADTRLARRVIRDIAERGRDLYGVINQYQRFVKPSFDEFILPSKRYADLIIPRGADNVVAISLLVQHVKSKLI